MKILSVEIDQHEGYANPAELVLTIDKRPLDDEFIYEKKAFDNCTLYYAECEGIVKFMAHSPGNEKGFGGHVFTINLQNGDRIHVKGPWSSRAGSMNNHFPHCVDCTIIEKSTEYKLNMAISLDLANKAAAMVNATMVMFERRDDVLYEVQS